MRVETFRKLEKAYSTKVCVYCKNPNCNFNVESKYIPNTNGGDIHIVKCLNYKSDCKPIMKQIKF